MLKKLYAYLDNDIYMHHAIDLHPEESDYFLHAHDSCEILGLIKGKVRYVVEGREYRMKPGSIILIRPAEIHRAYASPDEPYERFVINFRPDLLRSIDPGGLLLKPFYDRQLGTMNLYRAQDFQTNEAISFMRDIETDMSKSREERRLNFISNLIPLLNTLRVVFEQRCYSGKLNEDRDEAQIIIDYINDHLNDELSLNVLKSRFFLSQSQISRIFKASTGSTVLEYITLKRLMLAREHLQRGESSGEAARLSGFNDYSTFFRAYKKRFGDSPTEFKPENNIHSQNT